jgi:hypothetical protein
MKQLLTLFSLLITVPICAQRNKIDFAFNPAVTEKGAPAGTLTENRIDKNGGTLGTFRYQVFKTFATGFSL